MTESTMAAAVIETLGSAPAFRQIAKPRAEPEQVLIQVAAAGLNPVDLRIASGTFYGGAPPLPYVPGSEGVGVVIGGRPSLQGQRVRFDTRQGSLAEWTVASEEMCIPLPEGLPTPVAAGLGVAGIAAWVALVDKVRLRAGESVLVLGATGTVGQIAVQIARLLGARRIVAAGRDPEVLAQSLGLGADAVVTISDQDRETLQQQFLDAADGPVDIVFDPVWGHPLEAALGAAAQSARVAHLGESAGPEARLTSAVVRGKQLTIIGHSNPLTAWDLRARAFRELADHAAAGRIRIGVEELPLSAVQGAWTRQASSPHAKLVLIPGL